MSSSGEQTYDFVPIASIIAFVFIGVFLIIGLIGRCLALNQSTVRSAQSLDLVIYRTPPKPNLVQSKIRPSTEMLNDPIDNRESRVSFDEPIPVQRGPKNL
jgi:hypothetical protein